MSHGIVGTAHGILVFDRRHGDAAAAPDDFAHILGAFKGLESRTGIAVPEVGGIVLQNLGIHATDSRGGILDLGADDGVPVALAARLYPSHVCKDEGGAAPLTRLEEDGTHRETAPAYSLEFTGDEALGLVEDQGDIGAGDFVLDGDTARRPVLEVVIATQALPSLRIGEDSGITRVVDHGDGHKSARHIGEGRSHLDAPEGVVGVTYDGIVVGSHGINRAR